MDAFASCRFYFWFDWTIECSRGACFLGFLLRDMTVKTKEKTSGNLCTWHALLCWQQLTRPMGIYEKQEDEDAFGI